MNDREDKDLQSTQNMDSDDDFDYLKEIEAIEAQEKELELQRQKKKAELERLRQEREKEEHKTVTQKKREMKERKKEAEWLGDNFDDGVETVEIPKKKWIKRRWRILNRKLPLSSLRSWMVLILEHMRTISMIS